MKHKTISYLTTLALFSCAGINNNTAEQSAITDAKEADRSIDREYLDCYTLNEAAKQRCIKKINKLPAKRFYTSSGKYKQAFDAEIIKLGFINVLSNYNIDCPGIDNLPPSNNSAIYNLQCTDGNKYRLKHNPQLSEWKIIEG